MTRHAYIVGLVALVSAGACSSNSSSGGTKKPGATDGGFDSGHAARTFKLTWALQDVTVGPPQPDAGIPDSGVHVDAGPPRAPTPVPGVAICVNGHPEIKCTTSAADGTFELDGLPPLTNLIITLNKDGYWKEAKVVQTASTDMEVTTGAIAMFQSAKAFPPKGITEDPTKGALVFFAIGPVPGSTDPNAFETEPGVTVSLSPSSGDGPFFQNGRGQYRTSATSLNGYGYYYNLPAGDYTITFTDSQFDCAPLSLTLSAWGIPKPPTSVGFTILPGYVTDEIGVFCTQKSPFIGGDGG